MRLSKALKNKEMDVRLRDKLLSDGTLDKGEVKKYLTDLVDDETNMKLTDEGAKPAPVESEESTEL